MIEFYAKTEEFFDFTINFLFKKGANMEQQEFAAALGENIRLFRRLQHMTQQELADRLHRSLASVSKYEKGAIAVDAFTLCRIAQALGVPRELLLPQEAQGAPADAAVPRFFSRSPVYFCCPQSEGSGVSVGALELRPETMQVTAYCDLAAPADSRTCRYILCGEMTCSETNVRISASNPLLGGDFLFMAFRQLDLLGDRDAVGLCAALRADYRFRASRVLLSHTRIQPGDDLRGRLDFDKNDLAALKKQQYLLF